MRAGTTDNEVVMDRYSDRLRGADDVQRDFYIGARRHRVSRRMIVREDHGRGAKFQRALDDLANINRRVIDGSFPLPFMPQQGVLAIEKENMEFLDSAMRNMGGTIVEKLVRGADRGAGAQRRLQEAQGGLANDFEGGRAGQAHPGIEQFFRIGIEYL